MSSAPTPSDIQNAVKQLRAAEVPPVRCRACGRSYYLSAPPGWQPGTSLTFRCACGVRTTVAGPTLP